VSKAKPVQIVYTTAPGDMEQLSVNGKVIAFGNTWDDHGAEQLQGIEAVLKLLKIPYKLKRVRQDEEMY
jgi:hypothetical protein